MNRRTILAFAFGTLTLMACCCGGAGPIQPKPNAPIAVAEPNAPAAEPNDPVAEPEPKAKVVQTPVVNPPFVIAEPSGISAYDKFPEPHKSELVKEWKIELEAVRKVLAADKLALNRSTTGAEREKYQKYITIRADWLTSLQKNDFPYVAKEAADRIAKYRE